MGINITPHLRYIPKIYLAIFICLIAIILAVTVTPTTASAQDHRAVIFIAGRKSTGDSAIVDFSSIRQKLRNDIPANRFFYFSYAFFISPSPDRSPGWKDLDFHKTPIYSIAEANDGNIEWHVKTLDWLIEQIINEDPQSVIYIVGYSSGGVIPLAWAGSQTTDAKLKHIHRVITLDTPLRGVISKEKVKEKFPILSNFLEPILGKVINYLTEDSDTVRNKLPLGISKVKTVSIDNLDDHIVNGMPCGELDH
jgi:hypothetical protein